MCSLHVATYLKPDGQAPKHSLRSYLSSSKWDMACLPVGSLKFTDVSRLGCWGGSFGVELSSLCGASKLELVQLGILLRCWALLLPVSYMAAPATCLLDVAADGAVRGVDCWQS